MSWITRLLGYEKRAVTYNVGAQCGLIAAPSYTGMPVTEQTALGISALWCGIRVISEAVGSLPPTLYQETSAGKETAKNHPLYSLLHREPNPEQTRPVLWETAQAHALIYGNAFLEIERDGAGRPVALWNVHPQLVQVARDSATGQLVYRVTAGTSGGPPGSPGSVSILTAQDVLHVPGLSSDGSVGYRLLQILRDSIGFGLAAQRYGCSLFRNMGMPGGVIEVPPHLKLDENGRANLRRGFRQEHGGENIGTIALMEQGFKFTPMSFATNQQTQYQQILNFFVYEVARMLNVPPFKIHSLDEATWNNAGAQQRSFVNDTLRPWLEKWEAEIEKKLLTQDEKSKYFVEFDTDCLLRADDQVRFQGYATASGNAPWLTVNEIRERENLPPIEGGDVLPGAKPAPEEQNKPGEDDPEQSQEQGKPTGEDSPDEKEGNEDD